MGYNFTNNLQSFILNYIDCLGWSSIEVDQGSEGYPDPPVLVNHVHAGPAQHLPPPLPRHVHLRRLRHESLQERPDQRWLQRRSQLQDFLQDVHPALPIGDQGWFMP